MWCKRGGKSCLSGVGGNPLISDSGQRDARSLGWEMGLLRCSTSELPESGTHQGPLRLLILAQRCVSGLKRSLTKRYEMLQASGTEVRGSRLSCRAVFVIAVLSLQLSLLWQHIQAILLPRDDSVTFPLEVTPGSCYPSPPTHIAPAPSKCPTAKRGHPPPLQPSPFVPRERQIISGEENLQHEGKQEVGCWLPPNTTADMEWGSWRQELASISVPFSNLLFFFVVAHLVSEGRFL